MAYDHLLTSSTGSVVEQMGHFAFGEQWYDTGSEKYKFTTYERDAESGTTAAGSGNDYAQARYYVNRLGRFSSLDPLSGNLGNPQSLNHYAYVTNDPINAVDPTGQAGGDAYEISADGCADSVFLTGQMCTQDENIFLYGLGGGGFGLGGGVGSTGSSFGDSFPDPSLNNFCNVPQSLGNSIFQGGQGACDGWLNGLYTRSLPSLYFNINVSAKDMVDQMFAGYYQNQMLARQVLNRTPTSADYIAILPLAAKEATHDLGCAGHAIASQIPFSEYFMKPFDPVGAAVGAPGEVAMLASQSTSIGEGLSYIEMPYLGDLAAQYGPSVESHLGTVAKFGGGVAAATGTYQLVSCLNQSPN